ncbi:protein neprosin-like [Vicia villosa]|uniref:protein neprosin-like n=1 Tax=Vicia villosa TaxID=3911 RepID=UPI00273CB3EE|nr:protein neprosin-like [Vicia villosa]XP_058727514.1 protein neprosin-like [Vicia villosa]
MINILFLVMCLVTMSIGHKGNVIPSGLKEEDWELERELNILNKSPIKSIHTKSGYIVDCVDINKQPAFDHPLLKNHKLQRKPIFEKNTIKKRFQNSTIKPKFVLEKFRCPQETVPIRRTTKNDLIQGKLLFNAQNVTQNGEVNHFARVYLSVAGSPYYGVSGTSSVWNPKLYKGQSSAASLYVRRGGGNDLNKISLGWHVFPELYNDGQTYLYMFWASGKNGCFNMLCKGFVQVDRSYNFGARVSKTSTYGGEIMEVPLKISRDNIGNWWLKVADKNIGYFPAALFSSMSTQADEVGWGGYTVTPTGTTSPAMGSGHKPDNDFRHASYFKFVKYLEIIGTEFDPLPFMVESYNDSPNCYGVVNYEDKKKSFGYSLQFGGPGGKCST